MRERRKDYPQIIDYMKRNGSDLVSLKEFFTERFNMQERALTLAREEMERRLEGMNAFRDQINKVEGTLVSRKELDLILDRINKDNRAGIALWISILAVLISVLINFIK